MCVNFYAGGQQEINFHWRKCYYGLQTYILVRSGGLKLKTLIMDLLVTNMQHFTSQCVKRWTGVDYVWIIVM